MKTILLALALVSQSFGAITFLGNAKASAASTSTATTSASDTSGADGIVAVVVTYSLSACSATVSDNKSNTWTSITNYVQGNANICIFYAKNTGSKVGTGHTFSANPNGSSYPTIFVSWYSGTDTTTFYDSPNQAGAASATGTTLATGSITPSADGALVISGISDNDTGNKTVTGVTRQDINTNASFETGAWGYVIQTTAAAVNPTWTETNSLVARSVAIAAFKQATAPPPAAPRKRVVVIP